MPKFSDRDILKEIKNVSGEEWEDFLKEGDFWISIDSPENELGIFCHVMVDEENEELYEVTGYNNILDDESRVTSDYSKSVFEFYINDKENILKKGYLEVNAADFNMEAEEGEFGLEIGIYDSEKVCEAAIELTFFETIADREKYIEQIKTNNENIVKINDYFPDKLLFNRFGDEIKKKPELKFDFELGDLVEKDGVCYLINGYGIYDHQMWGDGKELYSSDYIMTQDFVKVEDKFKIQDFLNTYLENIYKNVGYSIHDKDEGITIQNEHIKIHTNFYEKKEMELFKELNPEVYKLQNDKSFESLFEGLDVDDAKDLVTEHQKDLSASSLIIK